MPGQPGAGGVCPSGAPIVIKNVCQWVCGRGGAPGNQQGVLLPWHQCLWRIFWAVLHGCGCPMPTADAAARSVTSPFAFLCGTCLVQVNPVAHCRLDKLCLWLPARRVRYKEQVVGAWGGGCALAPRCAQAPRLVAFLRCNPLSGERGQGNGMPEHLSEQCCGASPADPWGNPDCLCFSTMQVRCLGSHVPRFQ